MTTPPPSESRSQTRWVLGLIVLVMLFSTVDRYIVSILIEDMGIDLGLDDRQRGWILGPSFSLVYAVAVFPLARWADRGVRRSIIALGLAVWSCFTMGTAWVHGYATLLLMRMGVGLGEASASPSSQSLITDLVRPEHRGRGLSVLSIGAVFGLAVGMAGGGWVNELWGWRSAFLIAGAPGLLLAAVFRWTVREPARGGGGGGAATRPAGNWIDDARYLLSLPSMRWLIVAHGVALLYSTGKNMWEPTFIRRIFDMGSGAAGTWYFLTTPLPSALGLFLGGWWCDRWSRHDPRAHLWVPAIGTLASLPFVLAFLLWPEDHRVVISGALPPLPVAFLFSIGASILGAMYSAPYLAAVQGLARVRMRATAAAIFSLTGSGIGSGLGPLVIGDWNVRLAATHGEEAVRWALVWLSVALPLTALLSLFAARGFRADLARRDAPLEGDPQ